MAFSIDKSLAVLGTIIVKAPSKAGIYRMIGENQKILYIGKAKDLKKRLKQYSNYKKLSYRIQAMISQIVDVEIIETTSEIEALILELNLIKTEKPKYNILLTDDKTFPYLYLNTTHKYPNIFVTRNKNLKGTYFGPYAGAFDVHTTLDLLKKSFLVRGCSDAEFKSRTRPCLEYQIKRCSAPCVNYISEDEYKNLVDNVVDFLKGRDLTIKQELIEKMELASKKQQYEIATILRDRIKALTTIIAKQSVSDQKLESSDVIVIDSYLERIIIKICFFRNGLNHGYQQFSPENPMGFSNQKILTEFIKQFYNSHNLVKEIITNIEVIEHESIIELFQTQYNKKIKLTVPKQGRKKSILDFVLCNATSELKKEAEDLEKNIKIYKNLSKILQLKKEPNRIELFDNSHISGTDAIGAMVAVSAKGFLKQMYRKFNIKSVLSQGDDYGMLKEVLLRHYGKIKRDDPDNKKHSWPDLVLIDGGKGQAKIAHQVFTYLNLPITFFCIAKGKERNKGKERFCSYNHDYFSINDQQVLYYLQNIRDEVHRFVITSHRAKRDKKNMKSELDMISGIGSKRKKILLQHFGSVAKIKTMSVEDLQSAPTISKNIAEIIKKHLH